MTESLDKRGPVVSQFYNDLMNIDRDDDPVITDRIYLVTNTLKKLAYLNIAGFEDEDVIGFVYPSVQMRGTDDPLITCGKLNDQTNLAIDVSDTKGQSVNVEDYLSFVNTENY